MIFLFKSVEKRGKSTENDLIYIVLMHGLNKRNILLPDLAEIDI
jgi:hypothetical protein